MAELDEPPRVRLEHVVKGTWPILTLDRGDLLALLAAYDGIVGDATDLAERLAACQAARDKYQALWYETAKMVREEREQQAQAAPVLAAAVAHVESNSYNADEMWSRLKRAVRIWRAAREGTEKAP